MGLERIASFFIKDLAGLVTIKTTKNISDMKLSLVQNLSRRIISGRKKRLLKRFYITKKDMEAIIDESIESPYENTAEKAHRTLESLFGAKITANYLSLFG